MTRRRTLKGIANGLVGTFVSRNNDYRGYWALGVLRHCAERAGVHRVRLNLLSGEIEPPDRELTALLDRYRAWLASRLAAVGLQSSQLQGAEITLELGSPTDLLRLDGYGGPFACRVVLTDDLGTAHQATRVGVVAVHDPARESRRRPEQWAIE
jgi:hypothetical protein